jgi:hypothetical protein
LISLSTATQPYNLVVPMDPFKLLTQGARFNKNNPAHKAALFSQKQQQQKRLDATGSSDEDSEDESGQGKAAGEGEVGLPAELDFFKVGGAAPGAGGGSSKGKRKREDAGLSKFLCRSYGSDSGAV